MKYLVVTSWSPSGYETYGKHWLESFKKHWPPNCGAKVVTDEDIYADAEAQDFFRRNAERKMNIGPGYNYRMDYVRFAHKVFALKEALGLALDTGVDWLVWLDGDVVTTANISEDALAFWLPDDKDIVYLSRNETWDHPECGFFGINLKTRAGRDFIREFIAGWESDEVLKLGEYHDSYVFGELVKRTPGLKIHDLCPRSTGLDAFTPSPLGKYLDHRKGGRKAEYVQQQKPAQPPHPITDRYSMLDALVQHFAPSSILEVGVWNGERAKRLALAAHKGGAKEVFYTGYDLFEDATDETDSRELNVKKHNAIEAVSETLSEFREQNPWFSFTLTKGDTRTTLRSVAVDLAFVDGGHSVETIASDFKRITSDVILLDDYYYPENGHPDVSKYGVNNAVPSAQAFGPTDPVNGGGRVGLAYVGSKPLPVWAVTPPGVPVDSKSKEAQDITGGAFGGNVILKTRNCRPEEEIRENIKANLGIIKNWLKPASSHSTELILVSAGESLKDKKWLDEIRERKDRGASVWCVKHSLQTLLDNGIVPWACVLLDPRPHTGPSTHGFPREAMLENVGSQIKIFAASMVDPSVTSALVERGADVWGWHAAVGADEQSIIPKGSHLVPGGSTSVMRAISIGWAMGYRHMTTYAMDSCHFDQSKLDMTKTNPDNTPKYFSITVKVNGPGKDFLTDRDLLAQAQDFTRVMKENPMLDLEARGPGMVPFMWEELRGRFQKPFQEVYGFPPA